MMVGAGHPPTDTVTHPVLTLSDFTETYNKEKNSRDTDLYRTLTKND